MSLDISLIRMMRISLLS